MEGRGQENRPSSGDVISLSTQQLRSLIVYASEDILPFQVLPSQTRLLKSACMFPELGSFQSLAAGKRQKGMRMERRTDGQRAGRLPH